MASGVLHRTGIAWHADHLEVWDVGPAWTDPTGDTGGSRGSRGSRGGPELVDVFDRRPHLADRPYPAAITPGPYEPAGR
ncbi:MAG: hypothetical protein ACRDJN_06615 [Chloroflexota bacterium]